MRRFVGAVLIVLGALSAVAAVGLPLYVVPAVSQLPNDLAPCEDPPKSGCLKPSIAEAKGARFLQIKFANNQLDVSVNQADLRTTVEVIPQAQQTADEQKAGRLPDTAVIWEVYTTVVRTDTNETINKSSTGLALDRVSGAAVKWDGQWIDEKDSKISYTDQVYKFPFGTEQKSYKIYDSEIRTASDAKFVAVEDVDGIEAYHFHQVIPATKLNLDPSNIAVLIQKFAPTATAGDVYYSTTRDVWVDPVTGTWVKVREQPKQEFKPNVGPSQILLQADFAYSAETSANTGETVKSNVATLKLIGVYVPIGLGVLAILLLIGGFLLIRRKAAGPPAGERDVDLPLPESRESLRA